MSSLFLYFK